MSGGVVVGIGFDAGDDSGCGAGRVSGAGDPDVCLRAELRGPLHR